MYPSILQTKAWGEFQESQGHKTFYHEAENYSFLAILKPTAIGNYLELPYGPFLKKTSALKEALDELKKIAAKNDAFFIRIEPQQKITKEQISALKLKKTIDINPKYTRVIDLTLPPNEIFGKLEKNKLKAWRNYEKHGISIRKSKDPKDMKTLIDLQKLTSKKKDFSMHDSKYLTDQLKFDFAYLYVTEFEGKPINSSLFYEDEHCIYTVQTGTDPNFRKMNAPSLKNIEVMHKAIEAGKKSFDLWGCAPLEDTKNPWHGFSQFKASFGGKMVEYSGTYDYPLNRAKYQLYCTLRPINRLKRKIARRKH